MKGNTPLALKSVGETGGTGVTMDAQNSNNTDAERSITTDGQEVPNVHTGVCATSDSRAVLQNQGNVAPEKTSTKLLVATLTVSVEVFSDVCAPRLASLTESQDMQELEPTTINYTVAKTVAQSTKDYNNAVFGGVAR